MTSKQIILTVTASVGLALLVAGGITWTVTSSKKASDPQSTVVSDNSGTILTESTETPISQMTIPEYLSKAPISKAQEKAFKITNELAQTKNHCQISDEVSSDRYRRGVPTTLETELDKDVESGDLPLPNFTVEDMQNAKNRLAPKSSRNNKSVRFVLCSDINAINLHERQECHDGDIVNLASQFNALESVSNKPTAVKFWGCDNTQGPYCALQAVAATKHRESAHLQDKLTDGLKEALQHCIIDGKPITEKYPNVYKGGYLEMMEITDEKDMQQFLNFLNDKNSLSKYMKVLMQWVKCEGTGKKQLQFFTAAPSFQPTWYDPRKHIWENPNDTIMQFRREACVKLIDIQYRAMAQAAAIIAKQTGKTVRLHVTMVGHGVFNNPKETVPAALKALKEELQDTDAIVFLHNRPKNQRHGYQNIWKTKGDMPALGINPTTTANIE